MDGDTTFRKLFVGGLAWQSQRDAVRRHFEQFGEIAEAVVIADKHTGRSRGYGFVTFRDPEAAARALQDPTPVIDGRRANCNLAALGASQRVHPAGMARSRPATASSLSYQGSAAAAMAASYFPLHSHYAYPCYYGYAGGYSHENMYHMQMGYYGAHGGAGVQQQQSQLQTYYIAAGPEVAHEEAVSPYHFQLMQAADNQEQDSSAAAAQHSHIMQYAAHMQAMQQDHQTHATRLHGTAVTGSAADAGTRAIQVSLLNAAGTRAVGAAPAVRSGSFQTSSHIDRRAAS